MHGLPPTPEEIDGFVRDRSANAWEKLIGRLLASPRYGERWGRRWLDVARYAETGGYETDVSFSNAWRYRDYMIRSPDTHILGRGEFTNRGEIVKPGLLRALPGAPAIVEPATLRMIKTKAAWGRRLGTTLGLAAGLTLRGYTAAKTGGSDAAILTTFLGITGAATVGGFFLGRSADRKVTTIRIVP